MKKKPVKLFKTETASILIIYLMNCMLQNLPSMFSISRIHDNSELESLNLKIPLPLVTHITVWNFFYFFTFKIFDLVKYNRILSGWVWQWCVSGNWVCWKFETWCLNLIWIIWMDIEMRVEIREVLIHVVLKKVYTVGGGFTI